MKNNALANEPVFALVLENSIFDAEHKWNLEYLETLRIGQVFKYVSPGKKTILKNNQSILVATSNALSQGDGSYDVGFISLVEHFVKIRIGQFLTNMKTLEYYHTGVVESTIGKIIDNFKEVKLPTLKMVTQDSKDEEIIMGWSLNPNLEESSIRFKFLKNSTIVAEIIHKKVNIAIKMELKITDEVIDILNFSKSFIFREDFEKILGS